MKVSFRTLVVPVLVMACLLAWPGGLSAQVSLNQTFCTAESRGHASGPTPRSVCLSWRATNGAKPGDRALGQHIAPEQRNAHAGSR